MTSFFFVFYAGLFCEAFHETHRFFHEEFRPRTCSIKFPCKNKNPALSQCKNKNTALSQCNGQKKQHYLSAMAKKTKHYLSAMAINLETQMSYKFIAQVRADRNGEALFGCKRLSVSSATKHKVTARSARRRPGCISLPLRQKQTDPPTSGAGLVVVVCQKALSQCCSQLRPEFKDKI